MRVEESEVAKTNDSRLDQTFVFEICSVWSVFPRYDALTQ